jgi:hypothetical protein
VSPLRVEVPEPGHVELVQGLAMQNQVTEKVSGTFWEVGVRCNHSGKKVPDTFSVVN